MPRLPDAQQLYHPGASGYTSPIEDPAAPTPHGPENSCVNFDVRSATVCAALGDPQLEEVEAHKVGDNYFPAGSDLFLQGVKSEYLYTIKEGWVMMYTLLQDGRRQINEFCLTGAFIGGQSDMTGPSS